MGPNEEFKDCYQSLRSNLIVLVILLNTFYIFVAENLVLNPETFLSVFEFQLRQWYR